ncbi:MAG: hypothetical protein KDH15_15345 [Rhodocyclaceae bacterium]|nr:hypothetical protein [Rhodocyclaceae bacterium]
MGPMIGYSYFAVILLGFPLAILFAVFFAKTRQYRQLVCALMWLCPFGYEAFIQSRCTGECNIRVDLLVVYPLELILLAVATTTCVVSIRKHSRRRDKGSAR